MTDLEKLEEVLLNQQERGIKSGDWPECEAVIDKQANVNDLRYLEIPSLQVTFAFNRRGRFVGAYNWKE